MGGNEGPISPPFPNGKGAIRVMVLVIFQMVFDCRKGLAPLSMRGALVFRDGTLLWFRSELKKLLIYNLPGISPP